MSEQAPEPESPIRIAYDGPDYQGEMSALELAGVLRSLSDFVQALEAADALAGQRNTKVKVKAFDEGSFAVEAIVESIKSVGDHGGNALAVIGAVVAAFRFYWLKMRRRPKDYAIDHERQTVSITWLDDTKEEWTLEQWRLYNSERAKRSLKGLVAPLGQGATSMEIAGAQERIVVPADRVDDFVMPEPEPRQPERTEVIAGPDTVSFNPRKKWSLESRNLGDFAATLEDRQFIQDKTGSSFRTLRCHASGSARTTCSSWLSGSSSKARGRVRNRVTSSSASSTTIRVLSRMHSRSKAKSSSKPWYDRDLGDGTPPPLYIWVSLAAVLLVGLAVLFGASPGRLVFPLIVLAFAVFAWRR